MRRPAFLVRSLAQTISIGATMRVPCMHVMWRLVPEAAGRTLEKIGAHWEGVK